MAAFFNCGYARGVIQEAMLKLNGGDVTQYPQKVKEFYDSVLSARSYNVTMRYFRSYQRMLIARWKRWRDSSRKEYFATFNSSNWQLLSDEQRNAHTRLNCLECERTHKALQDIYMVQCFGKKKRKKTIEEHLCLVCKNTFSNKSSLLKHMNIHSTETPHYCSFCDEGFRLKSELKTHIKMHTGECPYMCSICHK